MKKIIIITISLFMIASIANAEELYVSSIKADLFSKPTAGSTKTGSVARGTKVTAGKEEGDWIEVTAESKKGWIMKMFTSKNQPGEKISILANADQTARMNARKRASANVTAASARGLMEDKISSTRSRSGNKGLTSQSSTDLRKMESLDLSEAVLLDFLTEGGIK